MKIVENILRSFSLSNKKDAYKVFNDPNYNEILDKDGCLCLPWLSPTEVEQLKSLVTQIHSKVDFDDVHIKTGFMLSAFTNDEIYKRELYEGIYPILKDKIDALLNDYIPLLINVFEKDADKEHNEVDIHQNPSFVSEPEYKSVSVWIPLQDVHKDNGTIGVLKGSHGKFFDIRASNMPMVYDDITQKLQNEWFEPINLKAGSIAIIDDSIIHWSYPNYTDTVRTAIQLVMVPKAAKHIYYYYNHNETEPVVHKFAVHPEYFFNFNCKAFPDGLENIGSVKYRYYQIQEKEVKKIFQKQLKAV